MVYGYDRDRRGCLDCPQHSDEQVRLDTGSRRSDDVCDDGGEAEDMASGDEPSVAGYDYGSGDLEVGIMNSAMLVSELRNTAMILSEKLRVVKLLKEAAGRIEFLEQELRHVQGEA